MSEEILTKWFYEADGRAARVSDLAVRVREHGNGVMAKLSLAQMILQEAKDLVALLEQAKRATFPPQQEQARPRGEMAWDKRK